MKTNLAAFCRAAFNIALPADLEKAVALRSNRYNGSQILLEETAREEPIKKLLAAYKTKFIEQPHTEIRFEQMNVSYDPRNIMPLEDKGTVYPNIRISDKWGLLTAANGALMSPHWDKLTLTVPLKVQDTTVEGDGWKITLNKGYSIRKESSGNYQLMKEE